MANAWIARYLSRIVIAVAIILLVALTVLVTMWWYESTVNPAVPLAAAGTLR